MTMDLLPKSNAQLDSKEVWSKFIKQKGERISECYGDYPELCGIIHKYIKPTDRTLIISSKNLTLSENLYDVGYQSLVNTDSNENSVKKMALKNEAKRPDMTFVAMDLTKMTFEDDSFNAVLERGNLDALMLQESPDNQQTASQVFGQIHRILKLGGRYICISLAQEHVAKSLMDYFSNEGWPIRVHQVTEMRSSSDGANQTEFQPPVFVFVCTKFKKMPQMTRKILEVCLDESQPTERLESTEAVRAVIKERHHYAMVRYNIQQRSHTDDGISVVLCNSATNQPRYTLHIVDMQNAKKAHQKFAIFIVPEGRENEWMFSSDAGRSVLAKQAGFQRLLVTCLHRDNTYENIDVIKKELSSKVMELAPPGLDRQHKVPFLTIGDDLGYREVRYRGNSEFSGSFVVEDIRSEDGSIIRQLIFLSAGDTVQSEVRLLPDTSKQKKKSRQNKKGQNKKEASKMRVDYSYLATDYQRFQVAGLATIPQFQSLLENQLDVLLIGLGGGIIPMFVHSHFPNVHLDVVDLDPAVVDVAKQWFGCVEDERIKLYAEDGLKFIADKASQDCGHRYHDVIFDIDNKDRSVGMSCPPKVFVELEFLKMVKEKILHPQGVFQLNIVARNTELKEQVIQDIQSVFPTVLRRKLEEDVNEIIYAFPEKTSLSDKELKLSLKAAGSRIQQIASSARTPLDPDTDLSEVLQKLEIQ